VINKMSPKLQKRTNIKIYASGDLLCVTIITSSYSSLLFPVAALV